MKKIAIIYGLIAGLIVGTMMFVTIPLYTNGVLNISNGQWIGYSTMIIALSMIFFGIRNLRDKQLNGVISFGKALSTGLLITLIASLIYCISWEICYNTIASNFMDEYTGQYLNQLKSSGISDAEYQTSVQEMESLKIMYQNFFIRFGMTLMEILPVGILISLISAFILRRKQQISA